LRFRFSFGLWLWLWLVSLEIKNKKVSYNEVVYLLGPMDRVLEGVEVEVEVGAEVEAEKCSRRRRL